MRRAMIIAAAFAAALAWGFWHRSAAEVARGQLEASQARVAGLERAGAELNKHLRRIRDERDRWQAAAADLEGREGINDPLSDYLRNVFDRVRAPRRSGYPGRSSVAGGGNLPARRNKPRARELRSRASGRAKRGK